MCVPFPCFAMLHVKSRHILTIVQQNVCILYTSCNINDEPSVPLLVPLITGNMYVNYP